MVDDAFLSRSYESYGRIEEEFNDALGQTLNPRGPEMLYDLVAELGLPAGASAVDVGCGEGRHAIELARRFGLRVLGIDPVERHVAQARKALGAESATGPRIGEAVSFEIGSVEAAPVRDASVDLVWCRDVLVHVDDLGAGYSEIRRILKPGGSAVIYQMFSTDRLEPAEAEWLLPTMGCVPVNMAPDFTEAAIRAAGLQIERCIVLGTEWGEFGQERSGRGAEKLLHAARLPRA